MIVGKIAGIAETTGAMIAAMIVEMIAATAETTVGMIATTATTTKITKKDSATVWTEARKITGIAASPTRTIPVITGKGTPLTAKVSVKVTSKATRAGTEGEGGDRQKAKSRWLQSQRLFCV